jgi:glutaredoxin 3
MAEYHETPGKPRTSKPGIAGPLVAVLLVLTIGAISGCGEDSSGSRALAALTDLLAIDPEAADAQAGGDEADADSATSRLEQQIAALEAASRPVIIEGGEVSRLDEADDANSMFSYTNSSGTTHIVVGLYRVPAEFRASARNLSNGSTRTINRFEALSVASTSPAPARKTARKFNRNRLAVTVYSATWCGACRKAKAYLDSRGVSYEDRDIDTDTAAKDQVRSVLGKVSIPLIDINGTYVVGYNKATLKRMVSGG